MPGKEGRTRAPHKPDCKCVVCKAQRNKEKAEQLKPAPIVAPELKILLADLSIASKFEFEGETYRIGEKSPEVAVCHKLRFINNGPNPEDKMWQVASVKSFGLATLVKIVS